jgi:hypothetical protein
LVFLGFWIYALQVCRSLQYIYIYIHASISWADELFRCIRCLCLEFRCVAVFTTGLLSFPITVTGLFVESICYIYLIPFGQKVKTEAQHHGVRQATFKAKSRGRHTLSPHMQTSTTSPNPILYTNTARATLNSFSLQQSDSTPRDFSCYQPRYWAYTVVVAKKGRLTKAKISGGISCTGDHTRLFKLQADQG